MNKEKNHISLFLKLMISLPFAFSAYLIIKRDTPLPMLVYGVMGVASFAMYGMDKKRAMNSKWRIPEYILRIFDLLGGWPGAIVAQQTLRHKNRKTGYQIIFWLIISCHIAGWTLFIWLYNRRL